MFPFLTIDPTTFKPVLTRNQQFVVLRNPVVSQPPQSGVHVSSVSLGSVPVGPFAISSPITVTVPQAAISFDFVGVAEFTPATIRVPEDFRPFNLPSTMRIHATRSW